MITLIHTIDVDIDQSFTDNLIATLKSLKIEAIIIGRKPTVLHIKLEDTVTNNDILALGVLIGGIKAKFCVKKIQTA